MDDTTAPRWGLPASAYVPAPGSEYIEERVALGRLAMKVLQRGIRDAQGMTAVPHKKSRTHRELVAEATAWLDSENFRFWCACAGLDADVVRERERAGR